MIAKARLEQGSGIDGFTVGALAHEDGMAKLYSVTRSDITFPMLMKVPETSTGIDPAMIVGFEMEQMILPKLSGPHVPRASSRTAIFPNQPYIVLEQSPNKSLYPSSTISLVPSTR